MWFYFFLFKTLSGIWNHATLVRYFLFVYFILFFPLASPIFHFHHGNFMQQNRKFHPSWSNLRASSKHARESVLSPRRIEFILDSCITCLWYLGSYLLIDWFITLVWCKCPLLHSFQFSIFKSRLNWNSSR